MFESVIMIKSIFFSAFDTCDKVETHYIFDNTRGEYNCYIDKDEDIVCTKEWVKAREEYLEASKIKEIKYRGKCN
jgi:hypothetical protein